MPTAYSKDKMFADPDSARRSLHDDLAKFFHEALHFETPLKRVISSTELANYIYKLPKSDKLKHEQFISSLKATKDQFWKTKLENTSA